MNFLREIKGEIISKQFKDKSEQKACIAGFMWVNCLLLSDENEVGFEISVENEEIINYFIEMMNYIYNTKILEIDVETDKLNKMENYIASVISEEAFELLCDVKLLKEDGEYFIEEDAIDKMFFENVKLKRAFIKGVFLSCGNLTIPINKSVKTGYHLSFSFNNAKMAEDFSNLLSSIELDCKLLEKNETFTLYVKKVDKIVDFLAFLQVSKGVLYLTDLVCKKELTEQVNRKTNCDMGNLSRQVEATNKQLFAFDLIEKKMGIEKLEKNLQVVITAKRENSEDTLSELALSLNISKSCLNHRMRKILKIAQELS